MTWIGIDLDERTYRLVEDGSFDDLWHSLPINAAVLASKISLPTPFLYCDLFFSSRQLIAATLDRCIRGTSDQRTEHEIADDRLREANRTLDRLRSLLSKHAEPDAPLSPYEEALVQLEECENRLSESRRVARELEKLEEDLTPFRPVEKKMTPELEAHAVSYAENKNRHSNYKEELVQKAEGLRGKRNLLRWSPALSGGMIIGFAFIVFSIVRSLESELNWEAPEFLVGAGVLGVSLLGVLSFVMRTVWLNYQQAKTDGQLATEASRYQSMTEDVEELTELLGLKSPEQLVDLLARVHQNRTRREELWEQAAAIGPASELEGKITRLCDSLGESRQGQSSPVGEGMQLREQVAVAENEVRDAEEALERAAEEPLAQPRTNPLGDRVEGLLVQAGSLSGRVPKAVWLDAADLVGAYLLALSDRRYTGVYRKEEGVYFLERGNELSIPVEEASESALQLILHAVQFALVERAALTTPLPLLLDDPFVGLDPERRQGAVRAVRRLGAVIQVLFATADPSFEQAADLVVKF
ncbi:MAG: hypothetical protein JRC77_11540 [Deltaproteobacteria bacterium]|nr:hypothetical protein [Deltaproteobacteria bacterium]